MEIKGTDIFTGSTVAVMEHGVLLYIKLLRLLSVYRAISRTKATLSTYVKPVLQ